MLMMRDLKEMVVIGSPSPSVSSIQAASIWATTPLSVVIIESVMNLSSILKEIRQWVEAAVSANLDQLDDKGRLDYPCLYFD